MPNWLPLRKDEVLPLFVQQKPTSSSIIYRLTRKWNSLHRLNRSFLIALTIFIITCLFYIQMISLPSQVEQIQEDSSNVKLNL